MPVNPFDKLAHRYDAWFDSPKGRAVFLAEVRSLRCLTKAAPRPWLEVGVGTGRFAEALRVDEGIDPSPSVLQLAVGRGIRARLGDGEHLPYSDDSFGCVFLIVTICFLTDPLKALQECARVLKRHGCVIIGLVPADSPWGKLYARKGTEGHPFYTPAKFYTCDQVIQMARKAGFMLKEAASCLLAPPDMPLGEAAASQQGIIKGAGFAAMRFVLSKQKER